jgi:hypothetical protein
MRLWSSGSSFNLQDTGLCCCASSPAQRTTCWRCTHMLCMLAACSNSCLTEAAIIAALPPWIAWWFGLSFAAHYMLALVTYALHVGCMFMYLMLRLLLSHRLPNRLQRSARKTCWQCVKHLYMTEAVICAAFALSLAVFFICCLQRSARKTWSCWRQRRLMKEGAAAAER